MGRQLLQPAVHIWAAVVLLLVALDEEVLAVVAVFGVIASLFLVAFADDQEETPTR